ncbi:FUSC family protein [Natronosporangium hydrolyticum]|uniref:FUSC family protein n=1 Tax=Natronosporangium hydrolyticum TaxID=2811111 RepID=A0A895YF31_9ACTN|nr:FUSC family protein [Natronosporangium hydrolyticum]QSB12810.1 FUSC family protein [Natronosporangium hydrolyticum]
MAGTPAESAQATGSGAAVRHRGPRLLAALLAAFAPALVAGALIPELNAFVLAMVVLLSAQTALFTGWRRGPPIIAFGLASLTIATVVSHLPALASLWMVIVAAGAGLALYHGTMMGYAMVGVTTGFVIVSPAPVATVDKVALIHPVVTGAMAALLTLAAGVALAAWTVALLVWFRLSRPRVDQPGLAAPASAYIALVLAVTTGLGVYVILSWYRVPVAAWLILTLYVLVMKPTPDAPLAGVIRRSIHRVAGTLAGSAAAVVLVFLVPVDWLLHLLGFGLIVAALAAASPDPRRYWRFVLLLTPGVVLLDSAAGTGLVAAEYRLAFTAAAAATAVVAAVGYALAAGSTRRLRDRYHHVDHGVGD